MNPRLRDLTVAILLAATTAGGCRVTEDTAPCPATDGDCSACRCPGSDSCGAPGDDSTPGEDTEEPRGDCSGAFFISDLDGNPAEEPKGNESWLFDPSQLRAFRVLVKPADWAWLQENALEEQYVPAVVELDGLRYHGAAIRFKGAYTTLQGCFDAEGNQVCPKLSMKLRFNEYDPCGRLRGVRRLVFNAAVYDFSMLRERVAYQVVRDMGLAGPRAVHATLQINDEPPSLYVLVEAPDKEFVQERWAKDEGNLYKEVWPIWGSAWDYENALETNETDPDVSRMLDFAAAVTAATEESFTADVSPFLDASDMAWYLAMSRGIADDDGLTRFWCVGEDEDGNPVCINHNYYWYDEPGGLFRIFPWDLETTLYDPKDAGKLAPEWWALPASCEPVSYYVWEGLEDPDPEEPDTLLIPPQCDPVQGRAVRSHPLAYLQGLADVAAAMEVAREDLPALEAQIEDALAADPRLWHDLDEWHENTGWLGMVLDAQIAAIDEILANH